MVLLAADPIAATDIQFVFENQSHDHRRERFFEIALEGHDALHPTVLSASQARHLLTGPNLAAVDASGVSAKVEIRPEYVLNDETQRSVDVPVRGIDRF